ncbi:MAG: glycosyltransferase, partial [Flavobacteriales bacterium]
MKCAIVLPCYQEAEVVIEFIQELDQVLGTQSHDFHLLVIDDASFNHTLDLLKNCSTSSENVSLHVFQLATNQGHQQAIYEGLNCALAMDADRIVVMDSDGEDDPNAIKDLLSLSEDIAFAVRGKRQEGSVFKLGYFFYKMLFKLVVGKPMHFGNFTALSARAAQSVVNKGYIHYSAFLSKLKLPKGYVTSDRRKRIGGESKMSYNSLMMHGLRSLVEYAEELVSFVFKILLFLLVILVLVGGYVLYSKLFTESAIAGWASSLGIGLFNAFLI